MSDQLPGHRPAGTVYGRGGVETSTSEPDRLPRVMIVGVAAGVAAVLGLGYAAWNSTGGGEDRAAVAAVAPSTATTSTAPQPTVARPVLAAGSWLLSPLDDADTYLTVNGDYAKMSPADPARLTVSAGLADAGCFSFQLDDGRYLRHFDYRLRFDAADDSDLFRADATFCQEAGTDPGTVRLRSQNYPDHLVHRRSDESLYIDRDAGTSFMVQVPS